MNTILQIPLSKELRDLAHSKVQNMGFSSLQETIRVFLTQLVANQVTLTFEHPPVKLSKKNELRYTKMVEDIESGKVKLKKYSDIDKMIKNLEK